MKALVLLGFLLCFFSLVEIYCCKEEHDCVLSITAVTQDHVNILQNISSHNEKQLGVKGLAKTVLWSPAAPSHIKANAPVHLYVHSGSVKHITDLLDLHKLTYSIMMENTQELVKEQTKNDTTTPRSGGVNYERYHSLEDIYFWANKTSQEYPDMVDLILIGSSFEKRPLYVLKLSGKRTAVDKAMWMDCGIHAREWIAPAFCLWFVNYALTHYNQNKEITLMLDKMDIYILPVMNPDGYKFTWTTNRMWRKNRSTRDDDHCVGVDLNRNFDANWCKEGASSFPCSEIYCGQHPESEPEVEAVAKFIRSHTDTIKLYFSMHSYSQMLLFPYSYTYEEIPNHKELFELLQEVSNLIRRHYRNIYKFGSGAQTIYLAPGGSDDWAYNLGIKYSFTFELQDRGQYGFLLPPNLIPRACNEALFAVKTIATRVLQKLQ